MMNFLELAHARYSCRKFSDKKVEQEKIDKILEAGMAAPTAVNAQPVKIWVMNTPESVAKVSQATNYTFKTQTIFAIGAKKDNSWVRPFDNKNFSEIDATIVATHMMLEIHSLGLGTTWVGYFDPAILHEQFPQMKGYDIVGLFPTGYPADDATPSPRHAESKPKSEMVEIL